MEKYKKIPSVDSLLKQAYVLNIEKQFGHEITKRLVRSSLDYLRSTIKEDQSFVLCEESIKMAFDNVCEAYFQPSLRAVINATGIILHTNLGRAPLGYQVVTESSKQLAGYTNLEFDLSHGSRGKRDHHISNLLSVLTGAEDALVVNNNAAAVYLVLSALCKGKEVVVSRGELIEIGGSFRIPDIMEQSGAYLHEVGTTNRTRIADYEKAIYTNTAMLFKAHKSNYSIHGFTEDVELKELVHLARANDLISYFDLGSGLIQKEPWMNIDEEPDVHSAISAGFDLISFSCDKLLGGPQAGVIVGKKDLIALLSQHPLMRIIRVDKITFTTLHATLIQYLHKDNGSSELPVWNLWQQTPETLKNKAESMAQLLTINQIPCHVIESKSQLGGGTLPDYYLQSWAVAIVFTDEQKKEDYQKRLYLSLMQHETPVIGVVREGTLLFDVRTISDKEIIATIQAITFSYYELQ